MTRIPPEACKQYACAYEAHYTKKDLQEAATQYIDLIKMHPNSIESVYAHTQIQNIVKAVVPADEFYSSLLQLLKGRFEK